MYTVFTMHERLTRDRLSVITREYKSVRQELLTIIFNQSAIAREQCTCHVAQAQNVSNFLEAQSVFFCKLGCVLCCNANECDSCCFERLGNYLTSHSYVAIQLSIKIRIQLGMQLAIHVAIGTQLTIQLGSQLRTYIHSYS